MPRHSRVGDYPANWPEIAERVKAEKDRLDHLDREIYFEIQSWPMERRRRLYELMLDSAWVHLRWAEIEMDLGMEVAQ